MAKAKRLDIVMMAILKKLNIKIYHTYICIKEPFILLFAFKISFMG